MTSSPEGVKDGGRLGRLRSLAGLAALLLLGGAAWSVAPRPVPPTVPPLPVSERALERAEAGRAARLAGRAPDREVSERIEALVLEHGRAEAAGGERPGAGRERLQRLGEAAGALLERGGEEDLLALRERLVGGYEALWEAARAGRQPDPQELAARVGAFGRMLERYGLVRGGVLIAPRPVVRVLYRARLNALLGRPLTWGMEPAERLAYHGWLAFMGEGAPPEMRLRALRAFAEEAKLPWPEPGAELPGKALAGRLARDVLRARVALLAEQGELEAALALAGGALLHGTDLGLRNATLWLQQRLQARQQAARRPAPGSAPSR